MTDDIVLKLLKIDLQLQTNAFDEYLAELIKESDDILQGMGIKFDGSDKVEYIRRAYAAWLYRKRADSKGDMPRIIRYNINNVLFKQKAGETDVTG